MFKQLLRMIFNKLYAYVLSTCNNDKHGWPQFTATDEIQEFDGTITAGSYYVETQNCFPAPGHGFYSDTAIDFFLELNIITLHDIKYQIKASKTKPPDFLFTDFVEYVANTFDGYKLANNGFIGLLAKNHITTDKTYFTTNHTQVIKEWIKNPDDVSYVGIYDDCYNQQNTFRIIPQHIVDAMNSKCDPMVWMLKKSKTKTPYTITLPPYTEKY